MNKSFISVFTIIISLLCIYYLSFTFISQSIVKEATNYATNSEEKLDVKKKQRYLDSLWKEPVFNLLGADYTYKEVKETELNLGLDLQGGMHVTLEVSPVNIAIGLSGENKSPDFLFAIRQARENIKGTQKNFVKEFYAVFKKKTPNTKLAQVFSNAANKGRISLNSTDEAVLAMINEEVDGAIDRSFNILRTRIDRFGTSQPNIQRLEGTGRIQIELPGIDNPERVRKLLQGVAKLEFWEVANMNDIFPILKMINEFLVNEEKLLKPKSPEISDSTRVSNVEFSEQEVLQEPSTSQDLGSLLGEESTDIMDSMTTQENADLASDSSNLLPTSEDSLGEEVSILFSLVKPVQGLPGITYSIKDTTKINKIFEREEVQKLIPKTVKFLWDVKVKKFGDQVTDLLELYPIKIGRSGKAKLTGETIVNAQSGLSPRAEPEVTMRMNASGTRIWAKMTKENIRNRVAIVLDNYVFSAPTVQSEIPNGSSSISGNFTIEEAKDLANILKAGSLPAPTKIVEDVVVGPTLGRVAQKQGIQSILFGLLIVIIFIVVYYAKAGLIANVALFFNVFFIMGILAQFGSSLTLPGIAGIVLTFGMAIDANVLIFERIKEELKKGLDLRKAISRGYDRAYWSIFDANLTTFIVGAILFWLGQGPIKGFAITLMIGIVSSFFSAVFITRLIVDYLASKGKTPSLSFSTVISKNFLTSVNFNFLSKRKISYTFSIIFITIGIVALVVKGLLLGVDFTGGRSYVVAFDSAEDPSELRNKLSDSFQGAGIEIKTFGSSDVLKITTSYLIEEESDESDIKVKDKLVRNLSKITGLTLKDERNTSTQDGFKILSSSKVSPTIADDIKTSSYLSGIFAIICIFLYIVTRFRKWQFGLGAIVALIHDTLFVISAFAIANLCGISFEVDQVFVAAILTIIGYSINDTVVVFDRIRENMNERGSSDLLKTFNDALNSTVSRTVITSLTTLIVVIVLFIFGGEVLRGFSFAMIVGILVGTYSSVFVATPLALDFSKSKQLSKSTNNTSRSFKKASSKKRPDKK